MRETWVQSLGQEDPLEKEMATHSSILAWRIPWSLVGYSPWGGRVGHDWATSLSPSTMAFLVAQMVKNLLAVREAWVWSPGWEEEGMATHSSILAWWIPMGRGARWATVHGITRVRHDMAAKPPPPPSQQWLWGWRIQKTPLTHLGKLTPDVLRAVLTGEGGFTETSTLFCQVC